MRSPSDSPASRDPAPRAFDAFVPPKLRGQPEAARQARLITGLSFGLSAAIALGIPIRVSLADSPGWLRLQLVFLGVFLAVPFVLRVTGRRTLAGFLALTAAITGLVIVAYFEGGLRSPLVILAPFMPLMAALILGRRAGWATAAVVSVLAALATGLHQLGLIVPESQLDLEQETLMRGLGVVITALMVAYVIWLNERERSRAENALRRARRSAVRAARAKSQFLANMSQEIQTPMAGIVGLSDLLLELDLPPEAFEHARTISASTEKLRLILDEMTRMEAGKSVFEISEFSLRQTVGEVVDLLRPAAAAKRVVLACDFDETVDDRRQGDLGRLRQVLLNLLGNAIKFTDEGRVDLRVDPGNDGTGVRFTIRDTGIGIDAEEQERLFAPREPNEDTGTPGFSGTGLGLVISQQLAEIMGGSIVVESQPRQGSTFTFTARLDAAPESPADA